MGIITQWLQTCATSHSKCRKTTSRFEDVLGDEVVDLPTRVNVAGTANNGNQPFLMETNGLKGIYLTLSHCWGLVQVTTTTASIIDSFKECSPTDAFCQYFRDAMSGTQRLSFQYLWVDYLCTQSKPDMRTET